MAEAERFSNPCFMLSGSHRFSGKTPVEEIVATMKEFVE